QLYAFAGNGNGTFLAGARLDAGADPFGLAVGDLNNDGRRDLVVASFGAGGVAVLANTGANATPTPSITATSTRTATSTPSATPRAVSGHNFTLQSAAFSGSALMAQAVADRILTWEAGTQTSSLVLRWSPEHSFSFPANLGPGLFFYIDAD